MNRIEWVDIATLPESFRPDVAYVFNFKVKGCESGMVMMPDGRILGMQEAKPVVRPDIKYGERRWGAFA